ncbi:UNVERIFIED_CONTAM: hypothetical protein GTU68_023995 [Idotea baltica]|nr:hypothetical protein [Idotea baltica]
MSRVLVTGGAGFIGSHLCDRLLEQGHEVICLDNFFTGVQDNIRTQVNIIEADICSEAACQAIRDFKPDTIFHLAAQINVRKSVESPVFDSNENVLGTVNMLETAAKEGVANFIFASTGGAIYGEQEYFPADEVHPIRPKCPYGVSKRAAEQYLEYYGCYTDLQTTSVRFANVYGPRQNPKGEAGVVAIFTDKLLDGKPLCVNGDGEQTRDFVYVGDVVSAMLAAGSLKHEEGFDIFNVGRGVEISVNEVVSALKTVWSDLGQELSAFVVNNGPEMPGEQLRSVISPEKLSSRVDWAPNTSLSQGLELTVKSFLKI